MLVRRVVFSSFSVVFVYSLVIFLIETPINTKTVLDFDTVIAKYGDESLCPGPPLQSFKPAHISEQAKPMLKLPGLRISFCTIPKASSWSTILMLEKLANVTIDHFDQVPSEAWLDSSWDHFILVRDPIQRFISGYVDICLRRNACVPKKSRCDLECRVKTDWRRFSEEKMNFGLMKWAMEYHLWPQSWFCNLTPTKIARATVLKMDKEQRANGHLLFFDSLRKHDVDDDKVEILKHKWNNLSIHKGLHFLQQDTRTSINNSRKLLTCILKIYKHDFSLFNLDPTQYLNTLKKLYDDIINVP